MLAESTRRHLSALVVAVSAGGAIYLVQGKHDHPPSSIALDEPITTWKMGTCEAVADRNQRAAPWKRCDDHPECWQLDAHIVTSTLGPVASVDNGTPSIAMTVTPWTDFSEPYEMVVRGDRRLLALTPQSCLWMWEAAKPWRALALAWDPYEVIEGADGAATTTELTEVGNARLERHADSTEGCTVRDGDLVHPDGTTRHLDLPPPDDGGSYQVLANDCNAAVMMMVSEGHGSAMSTRIDGLFYVRPR